MLTTDYRVAIPYLSVGVIFFCLVVVSLAPPCYPQQENYLNKLLGLWVSVDPPRDRINFYRDGLGQLKAHLPNRPDDASISLSGKFADIEVSGDGYDCFYDLSPVDFGEIVLTKKRGSNNCPDSYHLKQEIFPWKTPDDRSNIPRDIDNPRPYKPNNRENALASSAEANSGIRPLFSSETNRDIYGLDIEGLEKGLKVSDKTECENECIKRESSCVGYSFDRWFSVCFLKYELAPSVPDPSSVIGIRLPKKLPQHSKDIHFSKREHRRYRGDSIAERHADDLKGCEAICRHTENCIAFNYHEIIEFFWQDKTNCDLFSKLDKDAVYTDKDITAGVLSKKD